MTPILAIDPGTEQSAFVLWGGQVVLDCGIAPNEEILGRIQGVGNTRLVKEIACEQIRSYGMAVGASTFDTVHWCGRFHERAVLAGIDWHYIPRIEVKNYICHSSRAKDANIRQALIDRFGEPGTKKNPGPLYGVKSHIWAALAVAVTFADRNEKLAAEGVLSARAGQDTGTGTKTPPATAQAR